MKHLFKECQTHRLQRRERVGFWRNEERRPRENSAGNCQHPLHNGFPKICHKHSLKLGLIGTNTREIENLSQRGCHTEKLVCLCLNIRENVEQGKSGHEGTLSNLHPMERL